MSAADAILLLVSIVLVAGTVFQLYRNYNYKGYIENEFIIPFKLSEEPITGPIVIRNKLKAQKGYLRDNCQLPLHHGVQECTNTSSLRYYLDADTETCLAFKYSGCGGNANNFESLSECNLCFASDYSGCPVGSKPVPNLDSSLICENRGNSKCTGPNAYCSRGAFFGHCCDKTIRDKENSDRNPKEGCGPGLKKVQVPMGSFNMALLGKTCDSKFCPEKSTCHQGNYFAYCCTA